LPHLSQTKTLRAILALALLTAPLVSNSHFHLHASVVRSVVQTPPPNLKIAFIGDGGLGPNSVAVLNLIKLEGANAVVHSGDLEYTDNPGVWEAQLNSVLGSDFPYFVTIGNHDELAWRGPGGYQELLINRFKRLGISWNGDLGVQSSFRYQGLFFVNTAPGIQSGFDDGKSDAYIRDQLAADNSVWSICSWHKDMQSMQVGGKTDETGWGVYEEARKGGAIIATGHEHSYSRTYLLSNVTNQTVASTANVLTLTKGNSFAFVSGLGGNSVRTQLLSGNWWASISAATCLVNDPVCQPNANFGALFGVFNFNGEPNKAFFYFKDINGRVIDTFTVISNVELPSITGLTPSNARAADNGLTLNITGDNFSADSTVYWNGSLRPTTFISPTQVSASISSFDLAAVGTASLTVSGPGGTSNALPFTIKPALPVVSSLDPSNVDAGVRDFLLTINGAHFTNGSTVFWNGAARPTTFISSSRLTAAISLNDVAVSGIASISVSDSGELSNALNLTIRSPSLILFTEPNSDRAIALEATTLMRDPFSAASPFNRGADPRTRVLFFSPNLALLPTDDAGSVTAEAVDEQHRVYPLQVEFVGKPEQFDWLTQIMIRLPDSLSGVNALWVRVSYRQALSNQAMIALK
jgi:uncharacterized protein (TIGR03437 family)